jgi:ABC-2 type transport system ATP-binding protein
VLFLDEPTLGLDPQTRRSIWEHIQKLNEEKNVTIILTTHYTEEADYLCGRILVIDFGKIVALDTADHLKAQLEGDVVTLTFRDPTMISKVRALFEGKEWVRRIHTVSGSNNQAAVGKMMDLMRGMSRGSGFLGQMSSDGALGGRASGNVRKMLSKEPMESTPTARRLNVLVDDGGHRIPRIVKLMDEAKVELESVELHKPTLDDVFISVTGRNIRDEQGSFVEMIRRHRILRQARGGRGRG